MITFDVKNSVFRPTSVDGTVVLKYKENAFSLLMNIGIRDVYLKLVNAIDETQAVTDKAPGSNGKPQTVPYITFRY